MSSLFNAMMGAAGTGATGGGYSVDNSIVLDDGSSQYLERTFTSAGNRRLWTLSMWVKRNNLSTNWQTLWSTAGYSADDTFRFESDDKLRLYFNTGGGTGNLHTTRVFRDTHSWYHIVITVDTAQATAADRVKVYVNGTQETAFDTSTYPSQNYDTITNTAVAHAIGRRVGLPSNTYPDVYLAETCFIDGSALDATSFGEYDINGVWRPIDVTDVATDRDQIPALTSNSAPSPYAVTASSEDGAGSEGYRMFANGSSSWRTASGAGGAANIVIDVGSANAFAATSLVLTGTGDAATRCPTNFTFEGSNTGSFSGEETVLYTGSSLSWSASETKTFTFSNTTSFRYYKLDVTSTSGGTYVEIEEGEIRKQVTGDFGTNGFYLPFTDSGQLGADSSTGNQTSITLSGEWTGDTSDFTTLNTNIVPAGGNVGAIKSVDTFTGDFAIEFEWQGGANPAYLGVYEIDEDGTFSQTSADGGLGSMTDSFYLFFTSGNAVNAVNGSSTEASSIFTAAAGEVVKFQRSGSTFKVYEDGVLRHTFTGTSANEVRIVVAQNSSSMDWRDFRWVSGGTTIGNPFTPSGSPSQSSDTPTNVFANLSSITETLGGAVTLSNGNLNAAGTAAVVWNRNPASIKLYAAAGGKYIFAVKPDAIGGGRGDPWVTNEDYGGGTNPTTQSNAWACTMDTTSAFYEYDQGTGTNHTMSPAAATGDYMLVAIDLDNLKLWFGRYDASAGVTEWADNGTGWTGDPTDGGTTACATLTGNEFTVGVSLYTGRSCEVDFGQRSDILANITIPTGYGYISSSQIYTNAAPAIEDGTAHFQATLYTGDGADGNEVNQSGNSTFQPDFLWVKSRSSGSSHCLFDAVRGASQRVFSNLTNAEATSTEYLASFDADGFTMNDNSPIGVGDTNVNTTTYVGWQWKGDGTSGSTNTDGSITSTVNANDTAGFSIVKWTGTGANGTIGHGMSAAPDLIIGRNYQDAGNRWNVYHSSNTSAPETDYLVLNTTAATVDDATVWNDTAPTASVFSVGTTGHINQSSKTSLAYCFRAIPGYSAFGSYVGNGSSDGPSVILDFKPAWLLIKKSSVAGASWYLIDNARSPYNAVELNLWPDGAYVESNSYDLDLLSNGFKVRDATTVFNASGATSIYAAFAEHPFAGSSPATAR
jgi:hypothetical protein